MSRRLISIVIASLALPAARLAAQTTRPTLDQLSTEVRDLYGELQNGIVRVQVVIPTTQPVVAQLDHPYNKWSGKLDPTMRSRLEAEGSTRVYIQQKNSPTTQSTGGALGLEELFEPNLIPITPPSQHIVECIGLVLDDQGHILMPAYVDMRIGANLTARVLVAQQKVVAAKFIGSDQLTNITVLQLAQPGGHPIELAAAQPQIGSMVMMFFPTRNNIRLEMWTGGREDNALVIGMDGRLGGILMRGHNLSPPAIKQVLAQLLETGRVKRAKVGITVREVPLDDAARQSSSLAKRSAIRVQLVRENSAGAAAGIQVGDLILSLAGEPVEDVPNFAAAITARRGNTELRVLRNGSELKAVIDLQP